MDHPIFRPFGKPNSGNFSSARFFRYAKLTIGPGAEAPARFENGDPALVSISIGKGRVLIFASSADDESNDLYLKAVYAPLWQQALRYLENFREKRRWLDRGGHGVAQEAADRNSPASVQGEFQLERSGRRPRSRQDSA